MASSIKPIKVWGKGGPNPPKVAFVLAELDIPREIIDFPMTEVKEPHYTKINPNGRLPAIYDPNTDLTLWESGAILQYLVEKYDKDNKISFPQGSNEAYLANQWLLFASSGQGPYYGQAIYFTRYHSEPVPSVVERFVKEMCRVSGVLEGHLAKQDKGADGPWLVGNKFSYADIAFIPWQLFARLVFDGKGFTEADYPHVKDWLRRMVARPGIRGVLESSEHLKSAIPPDA